MAGADQLLLNVFLKGGRGLKYAADLALTTDEIAVSLDETERVLEDAGRFGSLGTELPKCFFPRLKYRRLDVAYKCSAATGFFVIGPSGYLRVCNHSPVNLLHYSQIEQLKTNDYWRKFTQKEFLPQRCLSCSESGDCDGGCREEAHILGGRIDFQHELVNR